MGRRSRRHGGNLGRQLRKVRRRLPRGCRSTDGRCDFLRRRDRHGRHWSESLGRRGHRREHLDVDRRRSRRGSRRSFGHWRDGGHGRQHGAGRERRLAGWRAPHRDLRRSGPRDLAEPDQPEHFPRWMRYRRVVAIRRLDLGQPRRFRRVRLGRDRGRSAGRRDLHGDPRLGSSGSRALPLEWAVRRRLHPWPWPEQRRLHGFLHRHQQRVRGACQRRHRRRPARAA